MLALSKGLAHDLFGFTPVPLPRQNLVHALRKLTELNAADTIPATVLTASLTADPKLHKNDLARLSHWVVCQVFAAHQTFHVAKLISALYLVSRKL
jgi:hypothetical protein